MVVKESENGSSDRVLRHGTRAPITSAEPLTTLRTQLSEMANTDFQPSFFPNTKAIPNAYRMFLTGLRASKASAERNKNWSRSCSSRWRRSTWGPPLVSQKGVADPRRRPPGHWQGTHSNLPLLALLFIYLFFQSRWLFLIKKEILAVTAQHSRLLKWLVY